MFRDSNEYTQYTILDIKKISPHIILSQQLWDFSKGLKNEFEIAVVNELSVFEPLKVNCIQKNIFINIRFDAIKNWDIFKDYKTITFSLP